MRIVAGRLGGRLIESPKGHRTHPMSEKVRGALYAALGDVSNLRLLDVYSGSGALAFEGISRGVLHATAIDHDKKAIRTINDNVHKLGIDNQIKVTQATFSGWSSRNSEAQFDLVIADPPYDNIKLNDISLLEKHLTSHGTLILSWPGAEIAPKIEKLEVVKHKQFGDAQLVFYQKIR